MAQFNHRSSLRHHFVAELLLVLLLLLPTGVWTAEDFRQYFAEKPPEILNASFGDMVTLPCVIKRRVGKVGWTRDGLGLGEYYPGNGSFENPVYSRYSMPGNLGKDNYSLVINTINADEDGVTFECQVGPGRGGHENDKLRARTKVNVVTPPMDVKIVDGLIKFANESSTIQLSCTAFGGNPPVQLTWMDASSGKKMTNVVLEKRENLTDGFSFKSVLQFRVERDDHNKTIICQGQNEIGNETSLIQLHVSKLEMDDDDGVPGLLIAVCVTVTVIVIFVIITIVAAIRRHRARTINITEDKMESSFMSDWRRHFGMDEEKEAGPSPTENDDGFKTVGSDEDEEDLESVTAGTRV